MLGCIPSLPLVTPCHGILTQSKCFHADQRVEENPPFSNSIHPSLPFTCVITKLIYFPAQEPLAGIIKDVNETKLITKKRWNKLPSPLYFCQFICSAFLYPIPLLVGDTDIHLLQAPDRWSIINVLKTRNRISFASQVMQIAAACYYFIHPFSQVVSLSHGLPCWSATRVSVWIVEGLRLVVHFVTFIYAKLWWGI